MTKLEGTYPIVLEYNWLTQHNPLVDQRKGTLEFNAPEPMNWPISPQPDPEPQNHPSETFPSSENLSVYPVPTLCANSSSTRHLVKNYPSKNRLSIDQSSS